MTAILPKPAVSSVDVAIELYNELLEAPVVTRAVLAGNVLQLETSNRSISSLSKRNAAQTLILDSKNEVIAVTPIVFPSQEVLHSSYSPDGQKTAIFRANGTGKERKLFIEIWETAEGIKLEEFDVGKSHGDWYFDGMSLSASLWTYLSRSGYARHIRYAYVASGRPFNRLYRRSAAPPDRIAAFRRVVRVQTRHWRDVHRQEGTHDLPPAAQGLALWTEQELALRSPIDQFRNVPQQSVRPTMLPSLSGRLYSSHHRCLVLSPR